MRKYSSLVHTIIKFIKMKFHSIFRFFFSLVCFFIFRTKMLKTFSGSRKSSPHRTPVKKQVKVPSLLDPSRLRPPPPMIGSVGSGINSLSTNTRINYGLSMQQQQQQQQNDSSESTQSTQNITLQLDEDEIMTISPDSKIV